MTLLISILIFTTLATVIVNYRRASISLTFLASADARSVELDPSPRPVFWLIIPAYMEENRIIPTLEYLYETLESRIEWRIVVCTTSKEAIHGCSTSGATFAVVRDWIDRNEARSSTRLVNYPKKEGVMADQVNFAVECIGSFPDFSSENDVILIYNADSRPLSSSLFEFENNFSGDPGVKIVQQSAMFFANIDTLRDGVSYSHAFFQSYWTLSHELPRMFRQFSPFQLVRTFGNAHCVGHGLACRVQLVGEACLRRRLFGSGVLRLLLTTGMIHSTGILNLQSPGERG